MVCSRCISTVRQLLENEGLSFNNIQLGEVELNEEPTTEQLTRLAEKMHAVGFELLDNRKARIVERIKTNIIQLVHHGEEATNLKLSSFLSDKLQMDYHYLTTLFTAVEGVTIEKYAILQRVERIKELMVYGELTLSEIAYQMGYSSVQHLSQQFKKITGSTPSEFKAIKENKRKPLDKV